jgi:hypothetical protein
MKLLMNGKNKDTIEYKPYLDFDKVSTYLNITEETEPEQSTENNQWILYKYYLKRNVFF